MATGRPDVVIQSELRQDLEAVILAGGGTRRGRHLRMRCPVPGHTDARPSCDVDLERGWVCRSCGRGGGLRELADLLGLETSPPAPRQPRPPTRVPPPPPDMDSTLWGEVWHELLEVACRQDRRLEPYRDSFAVADWLRGRRRAIIAARRLISRLGPDHPDAWRLAQAAARAETEAAVIESELDSLVRRVA